MHTNNVSFGGLPGKVFCQTWVPVFILEEKVPRDNVYPFQPEIKLIQKNQGSYMAGGAGVLWRIWGSPWAGLLLTVM